ncbi:MAG: endonuclease/exonuclease/phosphatase family protein [Anaerolineales bacterium]|nr:endonuclease/exonuclease/phosphatase family protein [Anaerolineales bacterium]
MLKKLILSRERSADRGTAESVEMRLSWKTGWFWLALVLGALLFATVAGFIGRLGWLADLLSHWRWHYLLAGGLLGGLFALDRRWKLAGAALAVAAVNGALLLPPWLPAAVPAAGSAPASTMRVVFLNVWQRNGETDAMLAFLAAEDPDVIVLAEFNRAIRPAMDALRARYPYTVRAGAGQNTERIIYSRLPFLATEVLPDAERPAVLATVDVGGSLVTIMGAHPAPPVLPARLQARNAQYDMLARVVRQQAAPVLLVGDLNSSPWSPDFQAFLRQAGLRNGRDGFGRQPTWPARLGPLGIPIDHALVTAGLTVRRFETGPGVGSDHLPIVVDVGVGIEN